MISGGQLNSVRHPRYAVCPLTDPCEFDILQTGPGAPSTEALDLTVPPTLIAITDEVIE